jgi:predicted ATPase/signal transduction histidine kinase
MSTTPLALWGSESDEFTLPEEFIVTQLVQAGQVEWLICQDPSGGESWMLATAAGEDRVFPVTQLLKNEFLLREDLSAKWAIKPVAHTLYQGKYALVYPAFSYRTLADLLRQTPHSLYDFLNSAVMMCSALSEMHQQGIVHGDIKPSNFFRHEEGRFRLGGFGLAWLQTGALLPTRLPTTGGTLAYMSPEHTSRTAHPVTSQSDLYSFGIVLYELLTGKLPFGTPEGSHAEWVHHHIASQAPSPHLLRADVPVALSSLILRLLAKSPDKRYQTAEGVLADLRRCLSTLTPQGDIGTFTPGLQDTRQNGFGSEKLYTDHPQAAEILQAFNKVSSSGTHSLVIISGAPGSGKSALIASSLKKLQQKNVLLTMVKGDRHSPVLPYGVLIAAFRSLMLNLLGLAAADVARWRTHFTRLLGDYAGLAVHFIPELGVLLNRKARLPTDASSLDARDRFNNMASSMIKALANPGRPLVILIDDLHWADQASLQLLQHLLSLDEAIPLMMVVAHRELTSLPCPLIAAHLTRFRTSVSRSVDISPDPLSVKKIAGWLAGLFHLRPVQANDLAQAIREKSGGNPLFTSEFVRQAVQDRLISQPYASGRWHYDLEAIKACHYTENVASRVLQQLETIPVKTRELLGHVACLGGSGELLLSATVLNLSLERLKTDLWPAVAAQLITLTARTFAFTHDRVQEAALNLIPSTEKDALHFRAANRLVALAAGETNNDSLFQAIYHIACVQNVALIRPEAARYRALILLATRQAKNTGDYVSALRFLQTADLLGEQMAPEERFTFLLEQAECEFLLGNLSTALGLCERVLHAPGKLTDKAVAACLLAEIHMRQSDNQLALETAIAWLAVFGIHLNRFPDKEECDAARIKLKEQVGKNPYTRFRSLPLMASRETEAVMNLMASASMFATFVSPRLHFMIVCKMLHLTMDQGITGASTFALSWYGVLCGDRYDEYSRGFASTLLARELVYQHDFTSFKARTLLPLDQVGIWTMPVTYAIECAKATFDAAVANGDRTSACLALRHLVMNYLTRGDHLEGVQTSIDRGLAFVRKAQYHDVEVILQMQRDYVCFLRNSTELPFSGKGFSATALQHYAPETAAAPIILMQFWYWVYKGMACFFAGEYRCASHCFEQAAPLTENIPGHIHKLDFHFYSALACTLTLTPESWNADDRQKVSRHYDKILTWSVENAKTFADKAALVQAEILRLEGNVARAAEQYEVAIALSREGQFTHINALAHELAASFASCCGLSVAADAYMKGAIAGWERWGAKAKVRQLELRHPGLIAPATHSPFNTVSFEQSAAIGDLQSVVTAVRALTEEINLDRLINILMMMLLERAGAQHCLLIRLLDGTVPEIEARAETTAEGIRVRMVKETPVATDLPLSVLTAVIRTGQEIRTVKPEIFSPFSQDPYLVASGAAVMCVPMFRQAQMVGVLYLENRLMPDVFTAEHSRIVSMLGAQAAVSLETVRLYAELLEENKQRRRVEKQLRASQTSLMLGEKISHTGTWHWHLEQDLMLVSDEYRHILGLPDDLTAFSMADFLTRVHPDDHPCIHALVEESVRNGVSMQAEFRVLRPDGECRYIKGIGDPVESWPEAEEYFGTIADITEQRRSEDAARLAQADLARVSRATTVGQLTASIAHEINQPLMSIVANAGASLRWLKKDPVHLDKACSSLDEILSEGKRAGEIICGLQALTRKHDPVFTRANLHLIARDILSLSRMELERRGISLELNLTATRPEIFCDRVQIQQVLLNLVVNAIDAMSENTERSRILTFASSNPTPETLLFEVRDTGTGLSEEVQHRLFDSFYTTKKEGMGMGLTICSEIIKKHAGELKAKNRPGSGSVFWFTLPAEPLTE